LVAPTTLQIEVTDATSHVAAISLGISATDKTARECVWRHLTPTPESGRHHSC
jgi:hypothetical protein